MVSSRPYVFRHHYYSNYLYCVISIVRWKATCTISTSVCFSQFSSYTRVNSLVAVTVIEFFLMVSCFTGSPTKHISVYLFLFSLLFSLNKMLFTTTVSSKSRSTQLERLTQLTHGKVSSAQDIIMVQQHEYNWKKYFNKGNVTPLSPTPEASYKEGSMRAVQCVPDLCQEWGNSSHHNSSVHT